MIDSKTNPRIVKTTLVSRSTIKGDRLKNRILNIGICIVAIAMVATFQKAIADQAPVNLRSAATFGVLAGSTVTTIPTTRINGDVGVFTGNTVTGAPIVNGQTHLGDPIAAQAQSDLTIAFNDAAGRTTAPITVAGNLGGQTLPPGLYKSATSLEVTSGDLTLDAQGNANAVWIFQMGSTFTTTSGRQIVLSGGAQAKNVFWQVGSSATIGSTSVMKGTIMADQSITLQTGASLEGRALARIAAVTLDANTVTVPVTPTLNRFSLIVQVSPAGAGSVELSPFQPSNGYENGTVVTLTASGTNTFYGWTGSASGTLNTLTVTMNTNKTITAHFQPEVRVILGNPEGSLAAWFVNENPVVTGSLYLPTLGVGWRVVGNGDFNQDGQKDFLFQHSNGQVAVWYMSGDNVSSTATIANTGDWRVVGANDFNGDGKVDILYQHIDGRLAIWLMNGITPSQSFLLNGGRSVGTDWKVVGIRDFNNDGRGDILFQQTSGQVAVWYMGVTGRYVDSSELVANVGPSWRVVGVGDFNRDGKSDLLWRNTDGVLGYWLMDGINMTSSGILSSPVKGNYSVYTVIN